MISAYRPKRDCDGHVHSLSPRYNRHYTKLHTLTLTSDLCVRVLSIIHLLAYKISKNKARLMRD